MLVQSNNTIQLTAFPCFIGNNDPTCNSNNTDNYSPRISGSNIVWENDGNLFFYDGRETVRLDDKNNHVHGISVQISGDNLVWAADDSDGDEEIFFFNGEETIWLTDNNVNDYSPQISGNNIVWVSGDEGYNREILLYDGNKTIQLTNNSELADVDPKIDWNPRIDKNRIVWQRMNMIENTASVMLATLNDTESSLMPPVDRTPQILTTSAIAISGLVIIHLLKKLIADS